MSELSKTYNPKEVEEKWLKIWLTKKLFKSKINPGKESFCMSLPPPNITGNLHMGHAFEDTIQDVLIRYNLMCGKNVLWQGGTDHASIGTEVVVEKDLWQREKKRKEDIGREEFLKRSWAWKEKHGNEIIDQMQKLGCFMDYDRLVFTMDENYTKAIRKVFVELYKEGLIYRGKRIVNWCPKCVTSLSDLEVQTEEIKGKLYHILYPFDMSDISRGGITVATTRPETMFGDIAVCVNPEDVRYKKLVGGKVTLPLLGKQIPVISDEAIKMEFGTGAVKTTPAHDANDFEIFERNEDKIKKLGTYFYPYPQAMSPKGTIQDYENIGIPKDICGLDRFRARELTLQKLEELGLLKQVSEYDQTLEKHDRCGTEIEPYLSDQWYVKMQPLAKEAIEVVEKGEIKFIPERYADHYLNWLRNIRDWCISRQLWWGHQIPVWYRSWKPDLDLYVMGFHERTVPQVFNGKSVTYRQRDHSLAVGDKFALENSQAGGIFGYGTITKIEKVAAEKVPLDDPAHGATYKTCEELLDAFKFHYPDREINNKSPIWIYTYSFGSVIDGMVQEKYVDFESPLGDGWKQDPDVLDTWFSSGLWPFVTLGWPEKSEYLKYFYPTTTLTTGREIINLWVSRMVFLSLKFTGKVPFKTVLIHPIIQTPDGKRMSKSKGNAIDPLEMIEKYGADANRFWYFSLGITGNQDVKFPGRKTKDSWESDVLEQYKRFANKIWNAVRFVLQNLEPAKKYGSDLEVVDKGKLTIADRWILHKYTELVLEAKNSFERYEFTGFTEKLYKFTWNNFCDWYIEIAKRQLLENGTKEQTQNILYYIVNGITRILHPIMPFITEEIWTSLPRKNTEEFIYLSSYPSPNKNYIDNEIGSTFGHVIETTETIRNLRQTVGIPWSQEIEVRLFTDDKNEKYSLENSIKFIKILTKSNVNILGNFQPVKPSTGALVSGTRILIPLSGLVDLDNMLNALNKKKNQFEKDKEKEHSKLNNTNFINNAPQDKIDEVRNKVRDIENQIKAINEQIGLLK